MANPLDKIWIRFGFYMTLSVILALGLVAGCLLWQKHLEEIEFRRSMPVSVRHELDQLMATGQSDSDRVDEIYDQYWPNNGPGLPTKVLIGLAFSFSLGLIAAFLSARIFIRPISSVAAAALRISQGDLSARTHEQIARGELADLLSNFNQMADNLERLERERQETIAAISHELRTPLTILQGRLHALCDGVITSSPAEHQKLLEQIKHLVRLVEDLNTLSLVDANRLSLHCTDLNLRVLVDDLATFYGDRAREHGVTLETDVPTLWVHADNDRLRQVLANVVENGLRYAASGGWLQILVRQEGSQVLIRISDRGPGLSQDTIDRVFDPFFRADHSRSRATGGTGLGLAVARGLIERQGGAISVSNRAEGGAEFSILLPLANDNAIS